MEEMKLTLVPVAHISRRSAALVRDTILKENPQLIGLELCRERLHALMRKKNRLPDIKALLTHPTSALMLIVQQLIGKWWKIQPGTEMIAALRAAAEIGKPVALLDRPVRSIAKDIEKIPIREKLGFLFWGNPLDKKITLKEIMKFENLNKLLSKMEKDFPVAYNVFVDSRNKYIFEKLLVCKPKTAVVVVGAAHVPGILKLAKEHKEINVEIAK